MLTDERYKQLMEDVGLPNSRSLLQALKQCAMEAALSERAVLVKAGEQAAVGFVYRDEDAKGCKIKACLDILGETKVKAGDKLYAHPLPAQEIPEWTDEQCAQFIGVAMRHVDIIGEFTWDDIRLGCTFANKLSASPKP